ncbi:hypothetical protein NQ315_007496 [Exocentrus adspersus]|uniref:Uncharacterized protein n=1 Tax=Exocentrus adspersus TaxID=1586481 RepID=A0AAV8W7S4_9CUCU|nr:hypothetical protein NQ315_007496 [Exocentrus adspersus]
MDYYMVTVIIICFYLTIVLSESDLYQENATQDRLNPLNDYENADTSTRDQDKRTVFNSPNFGWAKHVGIKPSGHKYLLGYSTVDLKYTPVIRPLSVKYPGYVYGKPKVHFHIKRPVVQLRPARPVQNVAWKPALVTIKPVLPVYPHHPLVSKPSGVAHVEHVHIKPVNHVDHAHEAPHVDHVHNVPFHVDLVHPVHRYPVLAPSVSMPQAVPVSLPQPFVPVLPAPQFLPPPLFEVTKPNLGVLPLGAAPFPVAAPVPAAAPLPSIVPPPPAAVPAAGAVAIPIPAGGPIPAAATTLTDNVRKSFTININWNKNRTSANLPAAPAARPAAAPAPAPAAPPPKPAPAPAPKPAAAPAPAPPPKPAGPPTKAQLYVEYVDNNPKGQDSRERDEDEEEDSPKRIQIGLPDYSSVDYNEVKRDLANQGNNDFDHSKEKFKQEFNNFWESSPWTVEHGYRFIVPQGPVVDETPKETAKYQEIQLPKNNKVRSLKIIHNVKVYHQPAQKQTYNNVDSQNVYTNIPLQQLHIVEEEGERYVIDQHGKKVPGNINALILQYFKKKFQADAAIAREAARRAQNAIQPPKDHSKIGYPNNGESKGRDVFPGFSDEEKKRLEDHFHFFSTDNDGRDRGREQTKTFDKYADKNANRETEHHDEVEEIRSENARDEKIESENEEQKENHNENHGIPKKKRITLRMMTIIRKA